MNKRIHFLIIPMFCIAMLSMPSISLAFRCGEEIVARGDSTATVLYRCGEPEYITGRNKEVKGTFASRTEHKRSTSYTTGGYQQKEIKTEIWHYNCGDNDFVYALTFEDNVLIKEETPTRGYGKNNCLSVKERSKNY
jgi:hypothetical protein